MRSAGDTEIRVRAALLRLWARVPGHATDAEWKSDAVRDEVLRDGDGGDEWKVLDGVQRVGRAVANGKGFNCSPGGWSELDDGLEYTYVRGTFRVRRGEAAKPDPALRKAFADLRAFDEVKTLNPLDTPDEIDATIQVTWSPGRPTALVTVRRKDSDLAPGQLRAFASALLEAAEELEANS